MIITKLHQKSTKQHRFLVMRKCVCYVSFGKEVEVNEKSVGYGRVERKRFENY